MQFPWVCTVFSNLDKRTAFLEFEKESFSDFALNWHTIHHLLFSGSMKMMNSHIHSDLVLAATDGT